MPKFTSVNLDDTITAVERGSPILRKCLRNEILMSFFDIEGEEAFREWWDRGGGALAFGDWCINNGYKDIIA